MKLLFDTCTFLWWSAGSRKIPTAIRSAASDPANEVYVSTASIWEITLKHRTGRLPLPEPPETFLPRQRKRHGFLSLPIDEASVLQLPRLPPLHQDPFDRILVCQAIEHGIPCSRPIASSRNTQCGSPGSRRDSRSLSRFNVNPARSSRERAASDDVP